MKTRRWAVISATVLTSFLAQAKADDYVIGSSAGPTGCTAILDGLYNFKADRREVPRTHTYDTDSRWKDTGLK